MLHIDDLTCIVFLVRRRQKRVFLDALLETTSLEKAEFSLFTFFAECDSPPSHISPIAHWCRQTANECKRKFTIAGTQDTSPVVQIPATLRLLSMCPLPSSAQSFQHRD